MRKAALGDASQALFSNTCHLPRPHPTWAQCEDQLLIQLSNPSPTSSHCAAPSACKATVTVPLSRQLYPTSSLLNSRLLGVGAHLLGPDAPTSLRKGLLPPRAHILDPTCCCHSWLGAGHMTYCWLSPGCGSSWLHHTPGGATNVTNTGSRGHWRSVAREPPALGLTPCTKN